MRRIVFDIETDSVDPQKVTVIHCVCCLDVNTNKEWTFTNKEAFNAFVEEKDILWIGHNIIEYDLPVLSRLFGCNPSRIIDTLVLSRLDDVKREGGHSLENWGTLLGYPKVQHDDWSVYSPAMLHRCQEDCRLTRKVFLELKSRMDLSSPSVILEHRMARYSRQMHENGFKFDITAAKELYQEVEGKVLELDKQIQDAFPPTIKPMKRVPDKVIPFNPRSAKQVIDRLSGFWSPTDKTKGHKDAEQTGRDLDYYRQYGWKLSEQNFATLSPEAPEAAHLLVKRNLLATRLTKLEEWFGCFNPESGRIHGNFISLGTWTHRFTHNNPNQANVAAEKSIKYKTDELKTLATDLGRRMRQLFICDDDSWLVGVDAEGIQLRVFAHYLNNAAFTKALLEGKKEDGTDVHSKNVQALGVKGLTRDGAKTFIYAYLLGAGTAKLAEILNCSPQEAQEAKDRFDRNYNVSALRERIQRDVQRSYFSGLDGRHINCSDAHRMLAGYLQAGEAVVVKSALDLSIRDMHAQLQTVTGKLIDFVHDELIFEVKGPKANAVLVKDIVENAFIKAGKQLKLKIRINGKGAIGRTWLEVH